jgi:tRNA(Ile)-lysidine synthase
MVTDTLEQKVLLFSRKHKLFHRGSRVLIAVSGGPDSTVLLNILYTLRATLGVELLVAHFDHGLRRSSGNDMLHVKCCAERLGLKCITSKSRRRAPANGSLEEFARNQRYEFLFKIARRESVDTIAVAHTQDDQAETVLMRILRGTGTTGMRAMLPKSEREGFMISRPMLAITKTEVDAYLLRHHLKAIHDPTNRSEKFFRNHLRLTTIPFLEKDCAPDIKARLSTLASIAAVDQDFIDAQAIKVYHLVCCRGPKRRKLKLDRFVRLHSAVRRVIIRQALTELKRADLSLGFEHVDALERLALEGKKGTRQDLPGGVRVQKRKKFLELFV